MSKKIRRTSVRWKFDNGDMSMPLVDLVAQQQAQYFAMASSDDPKLRAAGLRLLREAAEQAAAAQLADLRRTDASRKPRAKRPIKERVQEIMRPYKADGVEFKVFMQAWEAGALDGLRLSVNGRSHIVDDESDDSRASYAWGSLQKLYSTCR